MAIRSETKTISAEIQVITVPAEEFRQVHQKGGIMLWLGVFLMASAITYNHFVGNINESASVYFLLIFALMAGILLLFGSMWFKDYQWRSMAAKNGWNGTSQFRIEPDDEQRFLHE